MSEDIKEGISIWLLVTGGIIISMLAFTLVYWGIRPAIMERQREQNKQSQQFQDSLIRESRNLATGIRNANSPEQRQYLIDQFCPQFTEIKSPPPDLVKANEQYC